MRALALSMVCALAGCNYPEFGFADASALDLGVDSESPVDTGDVSDSGEDAADTTVDDVSSDALPDSAPDSMADSTKEAAVDGAVPVGCAGSTATFCVDWDSVSTPEAPFGSKELTPTGTVALEKTGARSSPNLFVAQTAPSTTESVVLANVARVFMAPTSGAAMRIDAWIKLESATYPTTSGAAFLFKIERTGGLGDGLTFSIDDTGLFVDRIAADYGRFRITSYKPKPGVWMHVRMDGALLVSGGWVKLWIDDMSTPLVDQSGISTAASDGVARQLTIGLYSELATGTFRARYDDVSFSFK